MDKRYDNKIFEKAAQDKWTAEKTYQPKKDLPVYSIDTPPPTVSGALHIGHIFSYTQTDILARYQRLMGKNVFYPFGFDDNGLATERFVEKKLKIKGHMLPRSEFIEKCLTESAAAAETFKTLWRTMGLSADLEKTYSTISPSSRKISQESFIRLYNKDLAYRKNEPTLYCANCRTSVAQAELDDKEEPAKFSDVTFKSTTDEDLVISTTRPELLSSCVALLFNENDKRFAHLKDQKAIVPIFGNEVPILADDTVDMEKGTGLVMCCTFGDKNDIEWYKKFNLPYRQSIGFNGKWQENTGPLANLNFKDARTKILELLKESGDLGAQRDITHNVNVHERCKKEIEYLAVAQWYIKVLEHKEKLIEEANKVEWYPTFMKSRCINWIENLGWDWGISRQRFYGIPFPIWHCVDCNHVIVAQLDQLPIDPQETKYDKPCPECSSTNIVPETDVMDTWNTSSITPQICFDLWTDGKESAFEGDGIKNFLPMSMRAQAHDIIRTWAFYTITKSWMHYDETPWKETVISGHVLSNSNEKLSKSKGNSKTSPERLLEQFPADAIRYWAASGNLGYDVAFSEEQIKIGCKLITKLWNAFKFTKSHIESCDVAAQQPTELGITNEWIITKASKCFTRYQSYLEKHEFGHALTTLEKFFWGDFCDNYLELIKNLLFNPDQYSKAEVDATQWTLYHVGLRILQMYAPYLPHITETLYGIVYEGKEAAPSIHTTDYNKVQSSLVFEERANLMSKIIEITANVRKLKTEHQLSLKTEIEILTINCNSVKPEDIKPHEQIIKGITQAKEIKYCDKGQSILINEDEKYSATILV